MSWRTVIISKNAKLDFQLGYMAAKIGRASCRERV